MANMNLGAFRSYNETDVINFLSLATATGSKGTILSITGNANATGYNPVNADGWSIPISGPTYANTYSYRYSSTATVAPTPSGANQPVVGMQLYDVIELNPYGEALLYRPEELAERQCVLSGQNVPIATAGTFELIGALGTISGGALGVVRGGLIYGVPASPAPTGDTVVGTFLGTTGRLGNAIFRLAINNI